MNESYAVLHRAGLDSRNVAHGEAETVGWLCGNGHVIRRCRVFLPVRMEYGITERNLALCVKPEQETRRKRTVEIP